ncbi:hypothetical protein [Ensifer sp. SL37]|uniref:hypothetical protein n=1 Tax=Ensifer sp. SL37 TaxID=2995137 RepID=UPI0022769AAD|nr:hypothetical protein [Ensifer sp. SL37]MCY1745389.1 hypothetical protein [Ensifer sp. SL37]
MDADGCGIYEECLAPAKQQPMTVAMPMKRKLELLHWAADRETLIVEDDLGS